MRYWLLFFFVSDAVTLQERAAVALKAIRNVATKEQRQKFLSKGKQPMYGRPLVRKRQKKVVYLGHINLCALQAEKPPTTFAERNLLLEAGLGERKVTFTDIPYRSKMLSKDNS